jgi:hypothetical protein
MSDQTILVKNLLAAEDLLKGFGENTQTRNGRSIRVTKINASTFQYQYSATRGASLTATDEIVTIADALDFIIYRLAQQ